MTNLAFGAAERGEANVATFEIIFGDRASIQLDVTVAGRPNVAEMYAEAHDELVRILEKALGAAKECAAAIAQNAGRPPR